MTVFPLHLLAHLASKEEQVRYMISGTSAEYLVPDELLNDAFHFCERMRSAMMWPRLSERERAAVEEFERTLKDRSDCVARYEHSTIGELVEHDQDWAALRNSAGEMFQILGATPPA